MRINIRQAQTPMTSTLTPIVEVDPTQPALGTFRQDDSVLFSVWAPFADAISVVGSFNEWNADAHPLERGEGDVWRATVPGAKAGDHYKFSITNGKQTFLRNDPYARLIDPETRNGVLYFSDFDWGTETYRLPPLNEQVIYELHVGTFGAVSTGKVGRFDHIRRMLPYLRNLGVNVIELMPPAYFPTELSWGYNVTHPFAIETSYGGPDSLKQLVKAAHDHGLGVVIDVVYNHFGPSDLDLWQFDGWSENQLGGIYFYNDHRAWTPWGENRPDYGRAEVRQYIRDNVMSWFREFHVDGLRLDMVAYIRNVRASNEESDDLPEGWSLLQWLSDETHKYFPGRVLIAEDLQSNEWLVKGTGAGGAGFHTQWDAGFVHPIREVAIAPDDAHRNLDAVVAALLNCYDGDPFKRVVYSESHDEVANGRARIPHEIAPEDAGNYFAQKRSTLAAGLVFTAPGVPMIFEGQEFLEDEWFRDDKPLDWSKLEQYRGISRLYRDLMQLRRNAYGTTRGLTGSFTRVHHVDAAARVIAYRRGWDETGAGEVLVIANFANAVQKAHRVGVIAPGEWHVRFNSDARIYSREFLDEGEMIFSAGEEPADGLPASVPVDIGPYALMILSRD